MGDTIQNGGEGLPLMRTREGWLPGKELQPLPIRRLGYRWGGDFAKNINATIPGIWNGVKMYENDV